MVSYTPEFEGMRKRWLRSLVVPLVVGIVGLCLFFAWGTKRVPVLPPSLSSAQTALSFLPWVLCLGGLAGATLQTYRKYRCPECGTFIERGNEGACHSC